MKIGLDLDGTLLDCQRRQTALLAALCHACMQELDADEYWRLKRQGYSNRAAMRSLGVDEKRNEALALLWEHAIEDIPWLGFDALLPGALETLCRWRAQGHTLHLLSARRNHVHAHQQLLVLGLDCFDSVDFVDPFEQRAKQAMLTALRLDVYIGDTERDAQCADDAGVPPRLVSSGLRDAMYLECVGGWLVVGQLSDVCLPVWQRNQQ